MALQLIKTSHGYYTFSTGYNLKKDGKDVYNGYVFKNPDGFYVEKKEKDIILFDGKEISQEEHSSKLNTFFNYDKDGEIFYLYLDACRDHKEYLSKIKFEPKIVKEKVTPEIICVPNDFDPRYERPLWHEDWNRAELLEFNSYAFIHDQLAKIFKKLKWEISHLESDGLRFLKINEKYICNEKLTRETKHLARSFIGNAEDIKKRKEDIIAKIKDCKTLYLLGLKKASEITLREVEDVCAKVIDLVYTLKCNKTTKEIEDRLYALSDKIKKQVEVD